MKYITHNRFKKLAACGEAVNIPYGTEMETAGDFIITTEGKPICYATSEAAKMHFARNDDGQGGDEAQSQEHPRHAAEDGYFPAVDGRGPNGTGGRVPVLSIVESAREAVQQLRHAACHGRALHADVR